MRLAIIALFACGLFTFTLRGDAPPNPSGVAALFGGRIEYLPPADWTLVKSNLAGDMAAVYLAADHDGYFAIQVLPENATINGEAAKRIVLQLGVNHKKNKQEVIAPAKIEKDDRFAIKIHERYKNKEGKTADETHLYRQVAGRAMELDVQSLSEDQEHIQTVRKIGEGVLLSARWIGAKPGKKEN